MATHRAIAGTETDPEAPITSALMKALDANVTAAFEGDATAVANGVTLRLAALQRLVAGDTIRFRSDTTRSTASSAFVRLESIGIVQSGQVRATLEHRLVSGGSADARVVRVRGGTQTTIQTWSAGGTFTARTVDVDVQPGDVIGFEHRGPTSNTVEARNIRLSTDTATRMFPADNFGAWENMV
jgi:hypothetical protein